MAKLFDLGLKLGDWLLKIEEAHGHLSGNSYSFQPGGEGYGVGPGKRKECRRRALIGQSRGA